MSPRLKKLKDVVNHPATQLAMGLILLISGGLEIAYDFMSTEGSFRWGVHHGVAILGLAQILGSLPECIDCRSASTALIAPCVQWRNEKGSGSYMVGGQAPNRQENPSPIQ